MLGVSGASSRPRIASPRARSTSRSSTTGTTRSGSSRARSIGCGSSSRKLDLARKEFVANASHELRTPLFSLAGFLELLADEDLDEATRREFLATTRAQVDRLTKLATDLLDLSRMDVGRIRIEHEDVGLAEVVRIVAEDLGALADASGHPLVVEADDDTWALADEERVLQITRALAGNALVHTPRGTTVRLRAERRGEPGRDRGRGRRAGDPAGASRTASFSGSTGSKADRPRAAVSGSRSPVSWRNGCTAP